MRRIALAITLAGLAATTACKKGDGTTAGGGTVSGASATALDVFPENTAGVFGVNVDKVFSSKMWQQFGTKALEGEDAKKTLDTLKKECDADPRTDVQQVVIGLPDSGENDQTVVLIKGKFDSAKLEKCAAAMANQEGKKVTFKTEGKITEITTEGEEKKAYIGWAGSDSIVIVPKAMEGDKAALEAVLAQKTSAKNNKELAPLIGQVNTGETMWGALAFTGKLGEQMGTGGGPKPKSAWGTIAHAKDLKINAGVRFANDKDAKDFSDELNKQFEGAKAGLPPNYAEFANSVKIEQKGTDVLVNIALTEAQLDKLVAELAPYLPMLPMMLGGGM
jgi:hypothetical protein